MNYNRVLLLGRLTRDPELRYSSEGTPVCTASLATNRIFTNAQGEQQAEVEYHNLVAFGATAQAIGEYMDKGSLMMVEGRLQTRSWEKEDQKHYRTEVVVERAQFGPRATRIAGEEALPIRDREPDEDDNVPFSQEGAQ